jgi:hypothetical protein
MILELAKHDYSISLKDMEHLQAENFGVTFPLFSSQSSEHFMRFRTVVVFAMTERQFHEYHIHKEWF